MPNNGEKENNISKNQLICDIVNNTHKFPLRVFKEHYIYFRKSCMTNVLIPSTFTARVCEFPNLEEELKKPSALLTIVLDGYDDFIKKQANKFQTFLSNCLIIPYQNLQKKKTRETTSSFTQGMSSLCPAASIIGLKNIITTSQDCKFYWNGKILPLYMKKLPK